MKVIDIFEYLNHLFPVTDAMDFDNVGILVGDPKKIVDNVLLALDCTLETVKIAKENNCQLIITHHPVIFESLKNVVANSVPYELIRNEISVISMHTNLDVGKGGINDTLCKILGLSKISSVTTQDGYTLKCGTLSPISAKNLAELIKSKIGGTPKYVGSKNDISKVLVCSGSGGNYIEEAINLGYDALITADVKHHHFLLAADNNVALFDAGHFNTEDIIVDVLAQKLAKKFKEIKFQRFLFLTLIFD